MEENIEAGSDTLNQTSPESQAGSNSKLAQIIKDIRSNRKLFNAIRAVSAVTLTLTTALLVLCFVLFFVPWLSERITGTKTVTVNDTELKQDASYKKQINTINRDIQKLSRKYSSYTSGQSYIVINTTKNRFWLYRNKELLREGFCSSGSYTMLKSADGERKWVFKTPKGKYRIQGKTTHPVWRRPDWSFVEEGLPIPKPEDPSRYEYGVLGDYAMAIGDGYLIHGTIYKRFLGMPVTHGCVRLNDEDLEAIFNTLSVGSKVYIF